MVDATAASGNTQAGPSAQLAPRDVGRPAAVESSPLVSIGLPVYNGAPWIRAALQSLLNQDYQNLELIISDNASTDDTAAICREFADRDPRVRYTRRPENIGAWRNFMKVLGESRGDYFMWAAHDDQWDPRFVSTLLSRFLRNQGLVYAMSHFDRFSHVVDEWGTLPLDGYPDVSETRDTFQNCSAYLEHGCAEFIYGLYRRDVLLRTRFMEQRECDFADMKLVNEIFTMGRVHVVKQVLFHAGVTGPRPVKSFAHRRLPGFKLNYGDYYWGSVRSFLRCGTLAPAQKARLVWRLTVQLARQVYVYEEIPLLRAVLGWGARLLGLRRSRRERQKTTARSLEIP